MTKVPLNGTELNSPEDYQKPTPTDERLQDGQKKDHWVLSPEERSSGHVRPVRVSYVHSVCGTETRMPYAIAETYAKNPLFYGSTWCCGCCQYLPVGSSGNFYWTGTNEKVGT